ncbi:MAG: hypothetical protein DI582_04325 [Azospirillum brasilense]|nr:MAG: hypothetical protein DI582_04325 [Azospirillum brasilense]
MMLCHSERSEESNGREILRVAQDDKRKKRRRFMFVIPAQAGIPFKEIPAFAGMTKGEAYL